MSASSGVSIGPIERLAVVIKGLLEDAAELEGYRRGVERLSITSARVQLRPGVILVGPYEFGSSIQASNSEFREGIEMLFPIALDDRPLGDDEAGPASLMEAAAEMVDGWRAPATGDGVHWSYRGSSAVAYRAPEADGYDAATGQQLVVYAIVATYSRIGRCGAA